MDDQTLHPAPEAPSRETRDGAHLLREHMAREGITSRAVAERIGVVPVYLSQILGGHRRPSLDLAIKIEAETGGAVPCRSWRKQEDAG
jgi:plasmid maintenance system antidote protein VapI